MGLQMTWQQQQQKLRKGPLGLRNLGNSCYLNSVLQCLTYTPPLANFCLKHLHSSHCDSAAEQDRKRDCPFCILEKRIFRSLSSDLSLDSPSKLHSCLKIYADHFRQGQQEDAHEFLRYVIDACHNACLRLKKLQLQQQKWKKVENGGGDANSCGGQTVIKEIFGGSLQSQVKCLSCGLESNKVDEIMDISLDILHSNSLEGSMKKFFQAEILDGNNKYMCDRCKQLVKAKKQMSLLQAPNVLVIQLKRFGGLFGGKIDRAVSFEEVLVLSSYMNKASQDPYPEYTLFGTIVHSGFSPDSGHYYAYIKDSMGCWYCCNDAFVKLSNLKEVLTEKVYILFFSRNKQRPMPAKAALFSNGVRSEKCNGKDALKSQKAASQDCHGSDAFKSGNMENSVNGPYRKEAAENAFKKDTSTMSEVKRVPFGPQPSFSSNGNSSNKISSAIKDNSITSEVKRVFIGPQPYISSNGNSLNKISSVIKKDASTTSEVNRVPYGPQPDISSNGNSSNGISSAINKDTFTTSEVKRVLFGPQPNLISNANYYNKSSSAKICIVLHKSQPNGKNGHTKPPSSLENSDKKPLPINGNLTSCKTHQQINSEKSTKYSLENGNGKSESSPPKLAKIGMANGNILEGTAVKWGESNHELQNGGGNHSDISAYKRKLEDKHSCILLADDVNSRKRLEEFKEGIAIEASSTLRVCGWTEEVLLSMRAQKKLCLQEAGNMTLESHELKKLLISEAKRNFLSKIPNSLKENLIGDIRTFSQEK